MFKKILVVITVLGFLTPAYSLIRDPTAPPTVSMRISGVIITPQKSTVLVDGKYFGIGDSIFGAKIVGITSHEVKLKDGNRVFSISVFQSLEKESVRNKKRGKGN